MTASTMNATEFKAHCLQVMDEVARTGQAVTITKRGKPVARIVPAREDPKEAFGALKGWVVATDPNDDLIEPVEVEWEVIAGTEPNLP
ncbi:type II toxin-antitoxin system Phd/YefM family antitoxin [Oceanibaculum pacificum]|uniref:Antitoxin n=1 Tax=Oceanibaculum pacificum TaxID=580166 RepID=A0A154W860_9PROT|nr:type II toxin-antitoxin system prevent-host-death family antitoxin [Oceanibaculum pacificum]KZD09692.1 prevent-host-death protein [Oceanibaculum pacificum]